MSEQGEWKPTTFLRYTATVKTSSRPARIVTDAGTAYLKAINNPEGPHVLACEWVGTNLARRFGLPTFDIAILELTKDDEIPINRENAQLGPSVVTRAETGETMAGEKSLALVENLDVLPLLIIFDTWVRNCDRYAPGLGAKGKPRMNVDNIFLSSEHASDGRFTLKAIDHGHIFTCGKELTPRLTDIDNIQDDLLYGFFPFFRKHLTDAAIIDAAANLRTVSSAMWQDSLDSIPPEWNVSEETKEAINRFLLERARFLLDNLPVIVRKDPNQRILNLNSGEG